MPITLFQFPVAFGLPVSVSPYCAKVELYFRLTGRDYVTAKGNVFLSPNRKVPYVKWPEGKKQAESDAIIARLEAEGPALNAGASEDQLGSVHGLVSQSQRILYYACLQSRFSDGWEHQEPTVRALVPGLLAWLAVPAIRKDQLKLCANQGFSTPADAARAEPVVDAIADALGGKDFILGDAPRTPDCDLWAMLSASAYTLVDSPARAAVRSKPTLMAYIQRLADRADLALPPLR